MVVLTHAFHIAGCVNKNTSDLRPKLLVSFTQNGNVAVEESDKNLEVVFMILASRRPDHHLLSNMLPDEQFTKICKLNYLRTYKKCNLQNCHH